MEFLACGGNDGYDTHPDSVRYCMNKSFNYTRILCQDVLHNRTFHCFRCPQLLLLKLADS